MTERPLLGPYLITIGVGVIEGLIFLVLFNDATEFRRTLLLTLGAVWLAVGTDNFRDFDNPDVTRWGAVSFVGSLIAFFALVITLAKGVASSAVTGQGKTSDITWIVGGVVAVSFSCIFGLGGRAVIRKMLS